MGALNMAGFRFWHTQLNVPLLLLLLQLIILRYHDALEDEW